MKISDLPIIDMTKEIEFEKWWSHSPFRHLIGESMGKQIWDASFTAGRLSNYALGKADERAEIERKLLAMAGAAFIDGKDDHAHWFRSLVNVLSAKA